MSDIESRGDSTRIRVFETGEQYFALSSRVYIREIELEHGLALHDYLGSRHFEWMIVWLIMSGFDPNKKCRVYNFNETTVVGDPKDTSFWDKVGRRKHSGRQHFKLKMPTTIFADVTTTIPLALMIIPAPVTPRIRMICVGNMLVRPASTLWTGLISLGSVRGVSEFGFSGSIATVAGEVEPLHIRFLLTADSEDPDPNERGQQDAWFEFDGY